MVQRFSGPKTWRLFILAALLWGGGMGTVLRAATPPHIVIFLADDLGYGDLGCYGHPIVQTPHLDAFAREGVRLTDCHSAGTVCSPSRASLLTGRTPYRTGFYSIAGPEGSHLRREEISLATLLKNQGYDTCFVGKWHLGPLLNRPAGEPGPSEHGFDHWFATKVNAFDGPENPGKFIRNGQAVGPVQASYCDAIVAEAVDWMAKRPNPEKPFFLLVCSHEPHTPVHPPEAYARRYASAEVDDLESTIAYGQVHRPWDRPIGDSKKYYYGTVTQLDDAFGRLMQALDDEGARDNSLVVFTSDNGPETPVTVEESDNRWEDLSRDRCFGTPGPWRGMKRFVFEGGHRVPGIARWPGKIEPGTVSSALVNGTDWLPTACAAAQVPLPQDRTLDGVDALPALQGRPVQRPVPACWMFPVGYDYLPGMAMRDGHDVMLGWFAPRPAGAGPSAWVQSTRLERFALYDLRMDRAQVEDLQTRRPEAFHRLQRKMEALWADIQTEAPDWTEL